MELFTTEQMTHLDESTVETYSLFLGVPGTILPEHKRLPISSLREVKLEVLEPLFSTHMNTCSMLALEPSQNWKTLHKLMSKGHQKQEGTF